jgi:hypothetical protein
MADTDPAVLREVNELIKQQKESLSGLNNEYERMDAGREKAIATLQTRIDNQNNLVQALQDQVYALDKTADGYERQRDALRGMIAAFDLEIAKNKERIRQVEDLQNRYKDFSDTIKNKFGIKSYKDSFFGRLEDQGGDLVDVVADLGRGIKDAMKPENLGIALLAKFAENTKKVSFEQEILLAEFGRTTGAARAYDAEIRSLVRDTGALATGQASVARAYRDLFTSFTEFTFLSEEQRASVGRLTIALEGLGVSGGTSGQAMQTLTKSFGISANESEKALTGIANLARDIGVPPAQMIEELNATGPALAKFGDQADDVFRNMATSAKLLGASVSELIGAVSQYDTFESAATAAGRLNSVLGGPLINSVELLNASEDERIELLMKSVEASGKSFQAMNKFERQAVANAAGIQDMALANKIFGQSFEEYKRAETALNQYNQSQKDLEEASQANITLEMRKKQISEAYAVALTPLIQLTSQFLGLILSLNEATGGFLIPFVGVVSAFVMLVGKLGMFVRLAGLAIPMLAGLGTSTAGLGAGLGSASAGLAAFGTAAATLLPVLLGIAAVIAAIGVAAAGLGYLFGGGEEEAADADRINAAAQASTKLEAGVAALTAMAVPLGQIEESIDHIVDKMNEINTGALMVAGLTMAVAGPAAMRAAAAPQAQNNTQLASDIGDRVGAAVAKVFREDVKLVSTKGFERTIAEFVASEVNA